MRFRLFAALSLLFPLAAAGQYKGCRDQFPALDPNAACIQLSGSHLLDGNGALLASGKVTLTVVDNTGTPVTYTPQGGTATTNTFVAQVTGGAIQNLGGYPYTIVNTLNASPSGLMFHYQLTSTDGATVYLDVPKVTLSSATGGYSLDSFVALAGTTISGLGFPRTTCSPTAQFNQSDAPVNSQPWICSQLLRGDNTNQWTQNPSASPICQNGMAIVSLKTGAPYCIFPEAAYTTHGMGLVNPSSTAPGPMQSGPSGNGTGGGALPPNAIPYQGAAGTAPVPATAPNIVAPFSSTLYTSGTQTLVSTVFNERTAGTALTGTQPTINVPGSSWAIETGDTSWSYATGGGAQTTANHQFSLFDTKQNNNITITFSGLTNNTGIQLTFGQVDTAGGETNHRFAVNLIGAGGVTFYDCLTNGLCTSISTATVAAGATGSVVATINGNAVTVTAFGATPINYTIPGTELVGTYVGIFNYGASGTQKVGGITVTGPASIPSSGACAGFLTSDGTCSTAGINSFVVTDNNGHLAAMPEKGTSTTTTTLQAPATSVAWDEDIKDGRFDCRNPKYAGGCLGATPGLAMQAFSDALVCYQGMTGKRAVTYFPPGTISVGTATNPTLKLPSGASYWGSGGWGYHNNDTVFQASYNHVTAVEIDNNLTSSTACSDGRTHQSTLLGGAAGGWKENGCGNGGCVNVPGDSNSYPFGGPGQTGISLNDFGGDYGLRGGLYANNNGDSGIGCGGVDQHCYELGGAANMEWYRFGINQSGQTYNPNSDGWHCNVVNGGLDNMFMGPFETYGYTLAPNASYMHICGVYWSGGDSVLGPVFSNRDEIGIVRALNSNGRTIGGSRIDAAMGIGLLVQGSSGNSFNNIDNSTSCSGFSTISKGQVFGPYIQSLGSGMAPGTYVISAVNGGADSVGAGATLTLTVGAGGTATGVSVSNPGTAPYGQTPSFPVSVGVVGGTPAVIGGTVYTHCDKLDDESNGGNSFSNVKNIYESFFGPNYSTGDIWSVQPQNDSFDRGTTGTFERPAIGTVVNSPKGNGVHRDLLDIAVPAGGIPRTGPAPDFSNGNHFFSADSSPTSWTGPFTYSNVMQDIWIYGGNANTTLPVSAGWLTCSGFNLNLSEARWYHFFILRDDVGNTPGTNMQFKEQCDSINRSTWDVNWDANPTALPPLENQGTVDSLGTVAVHTVPALGSFGGQQGGVPGANGVAMTIFYVYVVWVDGGKQVSPLSVQFSLCLPLPGFINNPCFQNVQFTLPQNWTRYQLYRNTSTDAVATPGLILDVTAPGGKPAAAQSASFEDTRIAPINSTTISSTWYGANVTGTYNWDSTNIPQSTSWPGVPGQVKIDPSPTTGAIWYCTSEDTWQKAPLFWNSSGASVIDYSQGTAATLAGVTGDTFSCTGGHTCLTARGHATLAGGTASTGSIGTITFTDSPTSTLECGVKQQGGASWYGLNSTYAGTALTITAANSVAGATFDITWDCSE